MEEYLILGLIAICVLLLVLVFLAGPVLLRRNRLASRARRDYRQARGTLHLHQISSSLSILNGRLDSLEQDRKRLTDSLERLDRERAQSLKKALCRHLAETELAQIDGIGPKLRDRILRYSFDGTLRSLCRAYQVRGVGQQKQWGINRWVEKKERELPSLMKGHYPNKKEIIQEHDRKERTLKKKLKDVEAQINSANRIKDLASAEEERLRDVTVAHFRQAYMQDREASEAVDRYLQGAFAEWVPMPSWFKTLISEYGG